MDFRKTLSISSSASYTSDGRHISSVTDSRGTKTSYTYDSKNRMNTGVTIGSGSSAQSTSYAYDGLDRVTSVSSGGSTRGPMAMRITGFPPLPITASAIPLDMTAMETTPA